MTTALIVSPDEFLCGSLRTPVTSLMGWGVETLDQPADALPAIEGHDVRAILLSKDGILTPDSLSLELRPTSNPGNGTGNGNGNKPLRPAGWNLNRRLAHSEREFLIETLRAHNNNRAATARALGISRTALYKKLHRLNLAEAGETIDLLPSVNGEASSVEATAAEVS